MYYVINLAHKKQTKANDCWYACVQMLKTWKAGGVKSKPLGEHTAHLHSGLLGHRLHADFIESKHMRGVLDENDLRALRWDEFASQEKATDPWEVTIQSVHKCLIQYGPVMVIGAFGEVFGIIKGLGHYVVVAGVDSDNDRLRIHDPSLREATWMDRARFCQLSNSDDETALVCK